MMEIPQTLTFSCLFCGTSFLDELDLYAHITSHTDDIEQATLGYTVRRRGGRAPRRRTYSCRSCRFECTLAARMKQHVKKHDGGGKENLRPLHCDTCLFTTRNINKLRAHNETHKTEDEEDRPFRCDACSKTYKDKHGLIWHIRTHHEPERMTHRCQLCGKLYPMNSLLQQHIATSHGDNPRVKCDECGKLVSRFYLSGHKKTHAKPKEYCKDYLKAHSAFECDFCKKRFPTKKYLIFHMKHHLAELGKGDKYEVDTNIDDDVLGEAFSPRTKRPRRERPFKCDEENCKYSTSQYSLLKSHKLRHNPCYMCVTCQEKFPTRTQLKAHMASHGDRPFQCDLCSKSYKDRHGLGWHKKVQHDPYRLKYTCELCGKTYPFASLLTQHINLTHAAEKQTVCDICGKNVSRTYLAMHRRTHGEKQFSCDMCDKTFLEKAYLKRHRMVHTGEKPYVCSVCGNSFRQHSTLTIHMRTHTGDRPYKCVLCDNAYKTHHNLKKHYKRSGHKVI